MMGLMSPSLSPHGHLALVPHQGYSSVGGPNMPKARGKTVLPADGPTRTHDKPRPSPPVVVPSTVGPKPSTRAKPKAKPKARAAKAGMTDMIRARVPPALKAKAEAIFAKLGMNA